MKILTEIAKNQIFEYILTFLNQFVDYFLTLTMKILTKITKNHNFDTF